MHILDECENNPWPCERCEQLIMEGDIGEYVVHLLRKHKSKYDLLKGEMVDTISR
jgi:hypothetical protein